MKLPSLSKQFSMLFPKGCLFLFSLLLSVYGFAQVDTSKPQAVTIVSSYKPVVKSVAKINLSATNLPIDTSKNLSPYAIPVQNLFYAYQPINLKPLALQHDTLMELGSRYFAKIGLGNYSTPYVYAAANFGDGSPYLGNAYGSYISSKGKIKNQDYSLLNLKATGSYFTPNNEIYTAVHANRSQYFLYGYPHDSLNYNKSDISQQLVDIGLKLGFKNTAVNALQINYNPTIGVQFFSLAKTLNETSFTFQLPAEKKINDLFSVKLDALLDMTHYSTKNRIPNNSAYNNNLYYVSPSVVYHDKQLKLNGGIMYVGNNGKTSFMPNIEAELALSSQRFIFQGGWIGKIRKNTFANLSNINPYLIGLDSQKNTLETEAYFGIKSSVTKHLLFSAKAALIVYKDYQFFINDTAGVNKENRFVTTNESRLNNFRLHGDISYIIRDKFNFNGGITINAYTGLKQNAHAWHMLPMEMNASLRWMPLKKLTVKSDFYLFAGGKYLNKANVSKRMSGGADWSVGADYKINKHIGAFINLNNIFGKNYERWHNYPVYGFNFLGGVLIRF